MTKKIDFSKLTLKKFVSRSGFSFKKLIKKRINRGIIITTGGSGGHIIPALAVAEDLIKNGRKVIFITDKKFKNFEDFFKNKKFFSSKNFIVLEVPIVSPSSASIFSFGFFALLTFIKSIKVIIKYRVKVVVGFGSYASAFTLLAAVFCFRKIILHEQNVIFGKVNKFFLRFAGSVLLSFPDLSLISRKEYKIIEEKYIISGLPSFVSEEKYKRPSSSKVIYDVTTKAEIHILITGGSAGATFFSEQIPPAIILLAKSFPNKTFVVYHQVRKHEIENVLKLYGKSGLKNIVLHIKPFFDNMQDLLSKADFAIIRGGAGSIIETALSKVFAIIIPMPNSSGGHQLKNAGVLSKNNAGVMLLQKDYTPEKLFLIFVKAINEGLFYFPVINTAYDLFKTDAVKSFLSVILYNELINLKHYE